MILIVDYGLGNLLSVAKAFEEVSGTRAVRVTSDPKELKSASHIVLPGVGNFKAGIQNLQDLDMVEPLKQEVLIRKKPFLGICLGMQLLAEEGEEDGDHRGLGWIPGRVRKINSNNQLLPHIGWQDIKITGDCPLFDIQAGEKDYYFVHGYMFDCPDEFVCACCDYGEPFPAVVQKDNIFGTQFHPEKSRDAGLSILRNFLKDQNCSSSAWFLSSS